MIKKIVLCVVMLLFTMSTVTNAGRPKTKKQDKEALYEARHEIDNYDFLYNDSDFDYGYDATATENLMDEAFAHLGTRYRRGAKGPSVFDCSGFTSYVIGKMNDLVFFTSPGSGRGVGHVGIVVDVNENGTFTFIHASTREGVKISNSTDGYYARRYVGVRRVM